jgi:hypothetical protein
LRFPFSGRSNQRTLAPKTQTRLEVRFSMVSS